MEALFEKKECVPGGALVLYTTKHGVTRRYAEQIAEPLNALVKEASCVKISEAKTYDTIVLGCCVYAFRIKGLEFFADHAEELKDKRLVLYTCGVNDPQLPEVRKSLDDQIRKALGDAADRVSVFHLRGRICWQNLGLIERLALKILIATFKKKPEQQRTLVENQLIENEGGVIDFTDEVDLAPVVYAARFGREEEV